MDGTKSAADGVHYIFLVILLVLVAIVTPPAAVPHPGTWGIPMNCAWLEGTITDKIVEEGDPHDKYGIAFSGNIDNGTQRYGYIIVSEITYNAATINESYALYTCEMFKIHDMIEEGTWVFSDLG